MSHVSRRLDARRVSLAPRKRKLSVKRTNEFNKRLLAERERLTAAILKMTSRGSDDFNGGGDDSVDLDDAASDAALQTLDRGTDMAFEDESGTIQSHINIGSGKEVSIKELAETVKNIVGFQGKIDWDTSKPDGTPRKLMDISKLNSLGWEAKVELQKGIEMTYAWYLENIDKIKKVKLN